MSVAETTMVATTQPHSYEELALLSLDAAIELEPLKRQEQPSHLGDSVTLLLELFENMSELAANPETSHGIANPVTMEILNRAAHTIDSHELKTIDDLFRTMKDFAGRFRDKGKSIEKSDLKKLQNFCLKLHSELLSESVTDESEYNPEMTEGEPAIGLH